MNHVSTQRGGVKHASRRPWGARGGCRGVGRDVGGVGRDVRGVRRDVEASGRVPEMSEDCQRRGKPSGFSRSGQIDHSSPFLDCKTPGGIPDMRWDGQLSRGALRDLKQCH